MKKLAVLLVPLSLTIGCATTGFQTVNGGAFVSIYTEGLSATSNTEATKKGEACTINVLGIYSGGDSSVEAARKDGKITKVSSIATKVFTVRPFYGQACTVVTGS